MPVTLQARDEGTQKGRESVTNGANVSAPPPSRVRPAAFPPHRDSEFGLRTCCSRSAHLTLTVNQRGWQGRTLCPSHGCGD